MSFVDPYIDTETGLLINSIGAKTQSELDQIEADFVSIGLLKLYDEKFRVSYSLEDLQYIHASLFGKVYPWAGQIRTVEIHKVGDPDNSNFAPSALIEPAFYNSMQELGEDHNLQGLNQLSFADRLAYHFSNVNYIHPFREGNGRTQRVFWSQVKRDFSLIAKDVATTGKTVVVLKGSKPIVQIAPLPNSSIQDEAPKTA